MSEKKTIENIILTIGVILILIVPEVLKLFLSAGYLYFVYIIYNLDRTNLSDIQALATVFIILIGPIGSYYFYEKSILKEGVEIVCDKLTSIYKASQDTREEG